MGIDGSEIGVGYESAGAVHRQAHLHVAEFGDSLHIGGLARPDVQLDVAEARFEVYRAGGLGFDITERGLDSQALVKPANVA